MRMNTTVQFGLVLINIRVTFTQLALMRIFWNNRNKNSKKDDSTD